MTSVIVIILIAIVVFNILQKQPFKKNIRQKEKKQFRATVGGIEIPITKEMLESHSRDRDGWLRVDSIDFYGFSEVSDNAKYIVACRDSYNRGERRINGSVVLMMGDKLLFHKRFERPHDARVGNNGNVIFNDWLNTNDTVGIFYAFNKDGDEIMRHKFKANVLNNSLSVSGRYALCSTAASDIEDDSNVTCLFDLEERKLLVRLDISTYKMRIDERAKQLHFNESGLHIIYSFDGECVQGYDESNPTWYDNCSGYELYTIKSEELESLDEGFKTYDDYKSYIDDFNEAMKRIPSDNWKSKINLRIGDIYSKLKMVNEAKKSYAAAVKANPKAAVKRRLQRLDKIK